MRKPLVALVLGVLAFTPAAAMADVYSAGALIIPMDTTHQDQGMLKAYGLVYELLRNGVPVQWAIRPGKGYGGVDFVASALPYPSGANITDYGYRGGPWIVASEDADKALPIVAAWKSQHATTVHIASASFDADIARHLVVAPTISMFADGNQKIARAYMQAAGIPDSTLNLAWPDASPDMLDPNEVAGPTTTNHADGKLFDADGAPTYCQLMSMHWGVSDARAKPEVVAEVRSFLGHATHFFAECQAVNAFENDLINGQFLTPNGFLIASTPKSLAFFNADSPFAQMDGPFKPVGGSEPAYSLPSGDSYKDTDIVMISTKDAPAGVGDVWMTGYLDGACKVADDYEGQVSDSCIQIGKVSYLGGHEYGTAVPISANPNTQGTRLFLNSLFEAPCATAMGQPTIYLDGSAPTTTASATVTFALTYLNNGPTTAMRVALSGQLPTGSTFVSATGSAIRSGDKVVWDLGNLSVKETGTVSFTVTLGAYGQYQNEASLDYWVGMNKFTLLSNSTATVYDRDTDGDGVVDSLDICPSFANPGQNLATDSMSCGTCGTVCSVNSGAPMCSGGHCMIFECDTSHSNCDQIYANGCEYSNGDLGSDELNCGACGQVCAPLHATGECSSGACTVGSCSEGYTDCNGLVGDGCEYATKDFLTDHNHCGNCATQCASTELCEAGHCVPSPCPVGTADCVAPPDNCETSILASAENCGGCGIACAPPNATGSCVAGSCTVGACSPGYSDCNGLAGDGCEFANDGFATDRNNCGSCGSTCAPTNASGACTAGSCKIIACNPDYYDCDGLAADGCESTDASLAVDVNNCGGCSKICAFANAVASCVGGSCGLKNCVAGHANLDGNAANGCEASCTPTSQPETSCNGVDDDCDGTTDEDYVPSHCGTGACAAASVCASGAVTCTPGIAGIEGPVDSANCLDGADNDCDGAIDDSDNDCGAGTNATGGAGGTNAATSVISSELGGAPADTNLSTAGGAGGGVPIGMGNAGQVGLPTELGGATSASVGAVGGASTATGASGGAGAITAQTSGAGPTTATSTSNRDDTATASEESGCGCRVTGREASPAGAGTYLLMLVAGLLGRRQRRVNRQRAL